VYITALFQSTVPLLAAIFLLMKKRNMGGDERVRGTRVTGDEIPAADAHPL
jgi:hypothetical protein